MTVGPSFQDTKCNLQSSWISIASIMDIDGPSASLPCLDCVNYPTTVDRTVSNSIRVSFAPFDTCAHAIGCYVWRKTSVKIPYMSPSLVADLLIIYSFCERKSSHRHLVPALRQFQLISALSPLRLTSSRQPGSSRSSTDVHINYTPAPLVSEVA